MAVKKKSLCKKILLVFGCLTLALAAAILGLFLFTPRVCELKDANPRSSAFMELRKKEAAERKQTLVIHHAWVPLSAIPKLLVEAVLSSEDERFFDHHGIDWHELRRAIAGRKGNKAVRGASTISQQLAKNLYLSPARSWTRKLKELVLTIKLESCLSKKRILECYLNLIELGNGIFGVEAASGHFFGKSVSKLTAQEMIRLVSVIPKPLRVSPRSSSKYLLWRMKWIAARLLRKGLIDPAQYEQIIQ